MSVDEMDLLGSAMQEPPLRPEAYEQARQKLQGVMAQAPAPQRGLAFFRQRRVGVGVGAGLGALAAGAAVVFAVSTTSPAPTPASPGSTVAQAPVIDSELIALATRIEASSDQQAGDASLSIRTQKRGGLPPDVSYNLYTDAGQYFGGVDPQSLAKALKQGVPEDEWGTLAQEMVKAARGAVDGDIEASRVDMVNAIPNYLGLGLSQAERQAIWDKMLAKFADTYKAKGIEAAQTPPTGEKLDLQVGNRLWNNSIDALTAAGGDTEVRAGVLRLLDTVSQVDVEKSTTDGRPTLTLTAAPELFGDGEPPAEVLTVDAETGVPLSLVSEATAELEASSSTYQVSRVTLADIEAGKA